MELLAQPLKGWGIDDHRVIGVQLDFEAVARRALPIVLFKISH